jgi:hypothetical protein
MQQVIEVKRRSMGANACTMSHYHWLKLNRDIAQRNTTWKRVYTRVHIAWQRFFRPGSGNAADTQCTAFHGAACVHGNALHGPRVKLSTVHEARARVQIYSPHACWTMCRRQTRGQLRVLTLLPPAR